MFLIEGERGPVLHTGDMRAEKYFMEALVAQSQLCRLSLQYLDLPLQSREIRHRSSDSDSQHQAFLTTPRLQNIYLDTERIVDEKDPLTKSQAILDVLQLLRLFPISSRVHVACWTFGYEEFLLSLSKAYPKQEEGLIHLDRYKMGLFRIMATDQDFYGLNDLGSIDKAQCGRFCACDDENCIQLADVKIQASEDMDVVQWKGVKEELLQQIILARQGEGDWPKMIPLPLQRHSPLCEIYDMIKILQPIKVTANTAHCPARFLLARISEQLQLTGSDDELKRQESLMGSSGRADKEEWKWCRQAWKESLQVGVNDKTDFFQQVARFRQLLRLRAKAQRDRINGEKMDAEDGQSTPIGNVADQSYHPCGSSASVPGPWSEQGRYAAINNSPFLTPAMRRAVTAKGGLSPDQATICNSGPTLTVELASRYIAYASMFLGWKIRNPSRYRPEVAWRAIRKLRPDLAKQSEEALLKELGLAIPLWDENTINDSSAGASAVLDNVPLPRAPPLVATQKENLPSTPNHTSKALPDSISPLQLGATTLLRRLDEEAASQELDSDDIDGAESDVELVCVKYNECQRIAIDDFASLEYQLRNPKRVRLWSEGGRTGHQLFQLILSEWQRPPTQINFTRFSHQLNLVGAAVRSRRGRMLLSWEKIDFKEAYQALKMIYSATNDRHLPIRGKNVLHYLQMKVRQLS